ncbi:zona pellucida sperm-binding protein 3 isoform X2 [Antennarius striatus]|uniref:zona pellucida sperm-binding protein 3 isoform X2 n=1 Tax=Antennarius striatus TaxID=241820 RepID=UPI0035AEC955
MNTKRCFFILFTGLIICAAFESPVTPRNRVLTVGLPNPPRRGATRSSHRSPGGTSPLSPLPPQGRSLPAAPGTPRSMRGGDDPAQVQSDFAPLPDVSVTCAASDFVLRVKPSFFGLGADAQELKLGNSCKNNGVLKPYGDFLFTYPLTECDAVRQTAGGYLLYKFVLHYEPSLKRFPGGSHRVDVDIECRYQRNHHVRQLTIQPTWKTVVVRKRLKGSPKLFQIELMDDSWRGPATSRVYKLGQTVNFQISAPHLPTGGKVYINRCYAGGSKSSLNYTIIDNFGCMLDGKRDRGASRFISRTDDTLRFSLKAFQFTSDPDKEVRVSCLLFVATEEPGPAHKSCSYRGNRWKALAGEDSICECCDSQCVTSKPRRSMMEGSAVTESLLVSDQSYADEDGFLPVNPASASRSRQGKDTIIHYLDEQHHHENPQGTVDILAFDEEEVDLENGEESGAIFSFRGPDIELGFVERVLEEENEFEENGSGYLATGYFSESEEEEGYRRREDEITEVQQVIHLNQTEGAMSEQMLPSGDNLPTELQPLVSEGEEENRKYTDRSKDDSMTASEGEVKDDLVKNEMTWYFTWR